MKWKALIAVVLVAGLAWVIVANRGDTEPPELPAIATQQLHPLIGKAIDRAEAKVNEQPESAEAWGELAMVLVAHDLGEEATHCLNKAVALDPENFLWPFLRGYLLEQADYSTALEQYEQALRLRPNYLPLRVRMALILMRLGEVERCETVLDEGLEFDPHDPYLLVTRGRLALLQNDSQQAEELFTTAAAQPGWSPQSAYLELIKLANRRGDHERAYEYQQRLAELPEVAKMEYSDPALDPVRQSEGMHKSLAEQADFALARGDLATAITAYQAFIKQRQDMPNPFVNLAAAYATSGRYDEAITTYQNVLDRFGAAVPPHLGLADVYSLSGRPEQAIDEYRQALKIKPDHTQAWFRLGLVYEKRGEVDEAIDCYREAVRFDPSFPQAQLALGVALMQQGQTVDARVHIARAVELVPGDPVPAGYLRQLDEAK